MAACLTQYAASRNLQLVRAAEFNVKRRERGCPKGVTVQNVCRLVRDEDEVRRTLDYVWNNSEGAARIHEAHTRKTRTSTDSRKCLRLIRIIQRLKHGFYPH